MNDGVHNRNYEWVSLFLFIWLQFIWKNQLLFFLE